MRERSQALSPKERKRWIYQYIRATERTSSVDILNSDFVWDYAEATGASISPTFYGAPKCRMLGRDLSSMSKEGSLRRYRAGISGMESGFPTWIWFYEIETRGTAAEMWSDIYRLAAA